MNPLIKEELALVTKNLVVDYKKNARRKSALYKTTGKVEYDEFSPGLSKSIIDEIDLILSKHYGFSTDETDFILNYDIKYRIGSNADS